MTKSVWPVLVASTFGVLLGHWFIVGGILVGEGDAATGVDAVLIGIGLAVLVGTVIVSAVATGREVASGVGAAGAGAIVAITVWVAQSNEVPLPALAAGLSVGAALAVRRTPRHDLRIRLLMAAVIFGYVWWVTSFSGAFAVIVAPLLPYLTVGLADFASEREANRHIQPSYAARK